jgi:hypothetical protein
VKNVIIPSGTGETASEETREAGAGGGGGLARRPELALEFGLAAELLDARADFGANEISVVHHGKVPFPATAAAVAALSGWPSV